MIQIETDIRGDKIYKNFIKTKEIISLKNEDTNYSIVHINPFFNKELNKYEYDVPVRTFSTQEIERILDIKFNKGKRNLNAQPVNSDFYDDTKKIDSTDKLFETYFISELIPDYVLKLQTMNPLAKPDQNLVIKNKIYLFPKSQNSLPSENRYDLIYPLSKTFESVDVFYLHKQDNGNHTLYFFQVTTAASHSVNQKGLVYIESLSTALGINIDDFALIFVVPLYSKLISKQKINPFEITTPSNNESQPKKKTKLTRLSEQYPSSKITLDIPQYLLKFKVPYK